MENQNEKLEQIQLTLSPFELVTLNKWMRSQEDNIETLQEEHEDLQKRFDDMTRMYSAQEKTIAKQSKRLKKLTNENGQLMDLSSMAESIFLGNASQNELEYLKKLYHTRFNGVYVPRVNQILTGDYSMENTKP